MKRCSIRPDDHGSAFPLGFMVAGMIFVTSFGVMLAASQGPAEGTEDALHSEQDADARLLLDLLVGRPGDWAPGADAVQEIGLQNGNGTGLDPTRLDLLRGAGLEPALNGVVDSDELLQALGLDPAAYGIHVRVNVRSDLQPLSVEHDHRTLSTAFIGDWATLTAPTVQLDVDAAMLAEARVALDADQTPASVRDRALLARLGFAIDDQVHLGDRPEVTVELPLVPDLPISDVLTDPSLMQGDIYPDDKLYLNNVLAGRLSEYALLVVGTDVDHNALSSEVVKQGIADWVRAGGILMVLGSPDASANWLQPIYHLATNSEDGPPQAPRAGHNVLHQPYMLQWPQYKHTGVAWALDSVPAGESETVLRNGDGHQAALAFLDGPVAGQGHVIITSLDLEQIAARLGDKEVDRLVTNVIAHLYPIAVPRIALDYGAEVPRDIPVSTARHGDVIWHPGFGLVPVEVQVALWRTTR